VCHWLRPLRRRRLRPGSELLRPNARLDGVLRRRGREPLLPAPGPRLLPRVACDCRVRSLDRPGTSERCAEIGWCRPIGDTRSSQTDETGLRYVGCARSVFASRSTLRWTAAGSGHSGEALDPAGLLDEAPAARTSGATRTGIVTVKVEPTCGVLCTSTRPPRIVTKRFTM